MIDFSKQIYFYDDRAKSHCYFNFKSIIFKDDEVCICWASFFDIEDGVEHEEERIVFNVQTLEVYSPDYQFWLATNDKDVFWDEEQEDEED